MVNPSKKGRSKGGGPRQKMQNSRLGVRDFAPEKVNPPPQPKMVEKTIKLSKRVQTSVALGAEGFSITPATLMQQVPGGAAFWSAVQVERIDVYGPDNGGFELTLTVAPQSDWNQPPFSVTDFGTQGNERARCGVRLGLLDRARWFGTADTTVLATVGGASTGSVIIQASVNLISPQ